MLVGQVAWQPPLVTLMPLVANPPSKVRAKSKALRTMRTQDMLLSFSRVRSSSRSISKTTARYTSLRLRSKPLRLLLLGTTTFKASYSTLSRKSTPPSCQDRTPKDRPRQAPLLALKAAHTVWLDHHLQVWVWPKAWGRLLLRHLGQVAARDLEFLSRGLLQPL